MSDCLKVRAAVVEKNGKIEYVWEQADINYYIDVLGYTFIGWEDLYI